jgi:hypothetical protein
VLAARLADGVKMAALLVASYVIFPLTITELGPVRVKVELVIVEGSIASLKVAEIIVLVHAPLAPVGATELTVGGV